MQRTKPCFRNKELMAKFSAVQVAATAIPLYLHLVSDLFMQTVINKRCQKNVTEFVNKEAM